VVLQLARPGVPEYAFFHCELEDHHAGSHRESGVEPQAGGEMNYCIYWSFSDEIARDTDV
jgi:hypothetical protein